jgi:hypothetical protein
VVESVRASVDREYLLKQVIFKLKGLEKGFQSKALLAHGALGVPKEYQEN